MNTSKKFVRIFSRSLGRNVSKSERVLQQSRERKERRAERVEKKGERGEKKRTSARVVLIIATGVITCNYREKLPQRSMNAV